MRILDRYIIRSFLVNYLLALAVMLGMYILLDLIVNFDNFTKGATAARDLQQPTLIAVLTDVFDYYAFQSLVIFQQVSGAIPLLAAGFTMVRMTRHHELTAMLSSGVSLYRVAAPIILCSTAVAALSVVNQEFVIPQPTVVEKLLRRHGEVNQTVSRETPIYFVRDTDNSLLMATKYIAGEKKLVELKVIRRDENGAPIGRIMAKSATWSVPPNESREAWVLEDEWDIDDRLGVDPMHRSAFRPAPGASYSTDISPQQLDLIVSRKGVEYLSSAKIFELIHYSNDLTKPMLYKMMHMRFTQPIMNLIMLLIGIPFLLTREPNKLVINMFYCLIVSGMVFASTFVIFNMGGKLLDPLLAAWLPVLIFGPVAAVMLDTFQT